MPSSNVLKAIGVTAEIFGRQLSRDAVSAYAGDLDGYPEGLVLEALVRCRKELRAFPSIADIISRIDDGRPGPEEAWASLPRDESETHVWTSEVAQAYGAAAPLLADDPIAARMAFLEVYRKTVADNRARCIPPRWTVSLGHDPKQRERIVAEAVQAGRISHDVARQYLPTMETPDRIQIEGPAHANTADQTTILEWVNSIKSIIGKNQELNPSTTDAEIEKRRQSALRHIQRMEAGQ